MTRNAYTHGHHESVLQAHRWRTAENSAAYLLPRLRPGMSLLDVGCGPGTITADLATRLAPGGRVLGIDPAPEAVEQARSAVAAVRESLRAGVEADVQVEADVRVGDVFTLESTLAPGEKFDVVHAHQVLQHLSDPIAALREMGRVCAPDGMVAVRDSDYSGFTWFPAVPELDEWLDLYRAVARGNGAEPDAGRHLKGWALAAGLDVVSSTAAVWCFASPQDVAWWGGMWAGRVVGSGMAEQALQRGLAGADDLKRLAQGWRHWAASPEAWFAVLHGELLCSPTATA